MEYLIIFFDNIHFAFCEAKLQCAKNYICFIIKYLFLSAKKKTLPKRVINRTYFAEQKTKQNPPKKTQPEHTIANILSII